MISDDLNLLQVCTGHCDMCKPFCVLTDCRVQVLMSFVRPRTVGLCLSSNEIPERTILTVCCLFFLFLQNYICALTVSIGVSLCSVFSPKLPVLRYGTVK